MAGKRIVVVGSANTDMVAVCDRLPVPGETVCADTFLQAHGGKGANQAVAAARAGADVAFVGRVGDDAFGRATVEALQKEGINTDFVGVDQDVPSGIALIMVDARGENLISVALGANSRLSPQDVMRAGGAINAADVMLLQLEIPPDTVSAALEAAREAGARVVLNPAPAPDGGLPAGMLSRVSVLTPNLTEARQLADMRPEGGGERAARRLLGLGVGAVIVTLGADGVLLCEGDECLPLPAAPAEPVDTVGAGDCFSGVLAVGMAEGMALQEAAGLAVCAAALCTEREGAQPSMPHRAQIERKFQQCFAGR